MKVYYGNLENTAGREKREIKTYNFLENLNIDFFRVDHKAADTMEACEKIDVALGVKMCKNLFLCNRQKTDFYLLLMPGDKVFKTKELSAQIGSARLSFASAEDMEKHLGLFPGSVSVMGLMNDTEGAVRLLIDEDLLKSEYIGCHPCVNTSSMKIKTEDILNVFLPATGHAPTYVNLIGE